MFWRYNLPSLAWIILIFIACAIPGKELPGDPFFGFDKIFHLLVFAILGFQVAVGLRRQYTYRKLRYFAQQVALVMGVVYGLLLEIFQELFLQGRYFDFWDIAANSLGVLLGLLAYRGIYQEVRKC